MTELDVDDQQEDADVYVVQADGDAPDSHREKDENSPIMDHFDREMLIKNRRIRSHSDANDMQMYCPFALLHLETLRRGMGGPAVWNDTNTVAKDSQTSEIWGFSKFKVIVIRQ